MTLLEILPRIVLPARGILREEIHFLDVDCESVCGKGDEWSIKTARFDRPTGLRELEEWKREREAEPLSVPEGKEKS